MCLLATLLLVGCGKSAGPELSDAQLQKLVLQTQDLPGYGQFAFGRETVNELSTALHRDPGAFGRQNGWTARYRRSSGTRGALTVASITDVFARESDAAKFLDAVHDDQSRMAPASGLKEIDVTGLGGDAFAVASEMPAPQAVRSVQVNWREGRYAATIAASGIARQMSVEDVLELARKQQRRLR